MTHRTSLVLLLLVGCGPGAVDGNTDGGNGGGDGGVVVAQTITVSPADAVLTVVNGVEAAQPYTATALLLDGTTRDVTAEAGWTSESPTLAAFDGSVLRATGVLAGTTQVTASWGGASASVPVTVRVEISRVVPPASAEAPGWFATATEDPARAPAIVYPSAGTLFPPNVGDFEVHFTNAAGNDLFEVRLTAGDVELTAYVSGAAPAGSWLAFLPAEWAVVRESRRGGSIELSVRGMQSASPGVAGSSAPIGVYLAEQDIEGGLYYWAAGGTAEGILRHDFSKPGEPAEPFYTTAEAPAGRCVACHAVSRDGTRMAVTFDGGDGPGTILDVATRTPLMATDGTYLWNFATFEPSGERVLTVHGGVLSLRDPATGTVLGTVPTSGPATHPDFSPDGNAIAYAGAPPPPAFSTDWVFSGGRIVVQPFDPAAGTFGTPTDLVPAGADNQYYPAWSPDGEWIAFNRSNEDSYDDVQARIWIVKADGTVPPFLLTSPDLGPNLTNSWVRWAPFEQTVHMGPEIEEPLLWLTFSSKRPFGVRDTGGRPQVWMAPFFPDRVAQGVNPSTPAFRLPFQDIQTNNHIAQWTETVVAVE